jgi:hypothetical protein
MHWSEGKIHYHRQEYVVSHPEDHNINSQRRYLSCSQQTATGPYPEPPESSSKPHIILILSSNLPLRLASGLCIFHPPHKFYTSHTAYHIKWLARTLRCCISYSGYLAPKDATWISRRWIWKCWCGNGCDSVCPTETQKWQPSPAPNTSQEYYYLSHFAGLLFDWNHLIILNEK